MTFSGSILFIGYLCLEKLLKSSVTQAMKYKMLIVTLLVYEIPWVWIKGIYYRIFGLFWRMEAVENVKGLINIADIRTNANAYRTREYKILYLFLIVWVLVAASLVVIKSLRFLKRRRALQRLALKCQDENLSKILECLQKEMHCRRKPEVVGTRVDNDTFTLGGIKPIIFLQKDYTAEELYWILKHEMVHITRLDMLIKLVQEFVCCFHWFNPLVYILVRKMEFICEASCDEKVLKGCSMEERERYAYLLDKNKTANKLRLPIGSSLDGNDVDVEKRIGLICEKRKAKCWEKWGATGVFVLMLFVDSLTAFAYPKMRHVKDAAEESVKELADGGNSWLYDYTEDDFDASMNTMLYPEQFLDEAGNTYPADPNSIKEPCAEHNIVSGIYQKHIKHDDKSCTVEIYKGTRCLNCGFVWSDELSMITYYDVCNH